MSAPGWVNRNLTMGGDAPEEGAHGIFWDRLLSILIFVLGLCAFIGVDAYRDFYLETKARFSGTQIEYSLLTEFCGWTNGKQPGETDLAYGLRSSRNMASAMLAMFTFSTLVLGGIFTLIIWIFHKSGNL